jgi:hypothetical protein
VKSALKLVSRILYQAICTSEDQLTLCLPESIKVRTAMALPKITKISQNIKASIFQVLDLFALKSQPTAPATTYTVQLGLDRRDFQHLLHTRFSCF